MLPTHMSVGGAPLAGNSAPLPQPPVRAQRTYPFISFFTQSELWQLSIKPFYQRMVVPLRWGDYLWISIGVAACYAIKRYACKFQNFYARPLGILAATGCLTIVYHVVREHINQHFTVRVRGLLQQLRTHVQAATIQDRRWQEFDQLSAELRAPEYEHLWERSYLVLEQLEHFRDSFTQPVHDQNGIERQRTSLLALL